MVTKSQKSDLFCFSKTILTLWLSKAAHAGYISLVSYNEGELVDSLGINQLKVYHTTRCLNPFIVILNQTG